MTMRKTILAVVLGILTCVSICLAEEIDVFWLAEKGTPSQLQDAVNQGATFNVVRDPDKEDEHSLFFYDETPLHRAAAYNHNPESIRFLIAQSLDVNAEAGDGGSGGSYGTPLSCAVARGNLEAAKELLKAKANPNSYATLGDGEISGSMFHLIAAEYIYMDNHSVSQALIEALIEAGGDVNSHEETPTGDRKAALRPRNQWTSSNPMNNMNGDLSLAEERHFKDSCTPLIYAVLYDNADVANILLDVSADVNIRNAEGKTALDYAKELPDDSKLRNSPAFERLKAATTVSESPKTAQDSPAGEKIGFIRAEALNVRNRPGTKGSEVLGQVRMGDEVVVLDTQPDADGDLWSQVKVSDGLTGWVAEKHIHLIPPDSDVSAKQLEKMVVMGKVPLYVKDKGKFFYNPEFGMIGIPGTNVRLRSQPNTKARVVDQLSMEDAWKWPVYLGEWTNPQGERWVLGDYKKAGIGTPDKPEPVWISAKYADPITDEAYALTMDAIGSAEMAEGEELIEDVRNHMYYSEYPPKLGYAPVGTQLENFFSNGEWEIEEAKDKKYGKKIAVFKGIGTLENRLRRTARRIMVTVRFAAETNANSGKKSLVITQISFNNETVYSRSRDYRQNSEIRQFDALYSMLGGGNAMSGAFSDLFGSNKYTLGDFLEMIYNIN